MEKVICDDSIQEVDITSPKKSTSTLQREVSSDLLDGTGRVDFTITRQTSNENELPSASGTVAISGKLNSVLSNIRRNRDHNLFLTVEQQRSTRSKRKRSSPKDTLNVNSSANQGTCDAAQATQGRNKRAKQRNPECDTVLEEQPEEATSSTSKSKQTGKSCSKGKRGESENCEPCSEGCEAIVDNSHPALRSKVETLKQLFAFAKNKQRKLSTREVSNDREEGTEQPIPTPRSKQKNVNSHISDEPTDKEIKESDIFSKKTIKSPIQSPKGKTTLNISKNSGDLDNNTPELPSRSAKPITNPSAPKVAISTLAFLKLQQYRAKQVVGGNSTGGIHDSISETATESEKPDDAELPSNLNNSIASARNVPSTQQQNSKYDTFKTLKNLGKKISSSQPSQLCKETAKTRSCEKVAIHDFRSVNCSQVFSVAGDDIEDVDLDL